MDWEFIQSINWEALVTAFLGSVVFQSVMIWVFKRLLKSIGMKSDNIDGSAKDIAEKTQSLLTSQESLHDKIHGIGTAIEDNILADKELGEKYTALGNILIEKIELINDFKDILDKYRDED